MNETTTDYCNCICSTDPLYTAVAIASFVIPLLISEILPLSNCQANGIADGIIKLIKKNYENK